MKKLDPRVLLSTLWVFAMFNYLYADIFSLYEPGVIGELMTGRIGDIEFTESFILMGSILMETAIVMVLLSRILKRKANRIVNILAGLIHTVAVAASLGVGDNSPSYLFFATIEIATTLFIIIYAWKWK